MADNSTRDEIEIRDAALEDEAPIARLLDRVYPVGVEARLVGKLRDCGALVLEQVALDGAGRLLGHIAYSRVTPAAIGPGHALKVACLAPVSVHPDLQRRSIGRGLVETSLKELKERGEDLVLVLGPPSYFPRFGFDAGLAQQIKGPYAGAAFMALALTEAGVRDLPIEVAFATPFEEFE